MRVHLLNFIALGCIAVVNCEFNFIGPSSQGFIYRYNSKDYAVTEQQHQRYQANTRAAAEQLFLRDLQPATNLNSRFDANNGRPDSLDRRQSPTSDEIAYSQNVQSFKPNRPLNSNIHFPPAQASSSAQIPQSRPSGPVREPPVRDAAPITIQNTGFEKEIPRERERESQRNPSAAVTDFAWNLFKHSNNQPNYVLSPLSPQILLSYLAYVADVQTRDELVNVGGFGNPDQLQTLVQTMLSDGGGRELQIASAFFVSQEMRLNKQFLDKATQTADVVFVDFKHPEVAGQQIIRWADKKLKKALKINKIDFAPSTKLALTSALYFKGKFVYTFQKAQPGLFYAPDRVMSVEMMNMKRKFRWGKIGNSAEWVAIPYESSDSLIIILPNVDVNIDVLIRSMTGNDIGNIVRELDTESSKANVNITLPKFKMESTTSLITPLKKMGIVSLFSQQAELPYLSDYDSVQVSNAQQQASIDVNEEGTVLVAFTNLNVVALSFQVPVPDIEFNINRPFIAIIADSKRNIPYCMAKITNPVA